MRALCIVGLVVAATWSRPAIAFECTAVPNSDPPITQVWNQRCLPFWINADSTFLLSDENEAAVLRSFGQWSNPDCTDLTFNYVGATAQKAEFDPARSDNRNVLMTVETATEAAQVIGVPDLLAITLTSFSVETGEIFDSDIILNLAEFNFERVANTATCEAESNFTIFDLENTLVHEIGHFIGFDHVTEADATMFASAQACEILKRDLSADDLNGLCSVYPVDAPPQTCSPAADYGSGGFLTRFRDQCNRPEEGCRCTFASTRNSGPWFALLLFIPFVLRRRA